MKEIEYLVTGGTGLVGYALQKKLQNVAFVSSSDYDLTKENEVKSMFEKYKPEKVIHLAAKVGGIFYNINHPAELVYQNVMINTNVVHYAYKYNVEKLIAPISNCAYPDVVEKYPLKENQLYNGPPQITNFAYAYSKRLLAVQIQAYRDQYKCNFISVIPCNMYGPNDNFNKNDSHFIAALLRKIYEIKQDNEKTLTLLGSGKPLRQYLYSEDFAQILLILLEKYNGKEPVNVAPEKENLSIDEIARIALKATNSEDINIVFDDASPDGQYRKDIDTSKLAEIINDFKFTPLEDGIKKTYEWYIKNKSKYEKRMET